MKKPTISSYYSTIWRWHFYAGLFVAPFLIILATTVLGMVLLANTTGRDNDRVKVMPQVTTVPISTQAKNALATLPDGTVAQYTSPRSSDTVALFRVKNTTTDNMVLVNPYNGDVIKTFPRKSNLYHKFDNFHAELMLGKVGDFIQELTASLTVLLIIMGIYLWWQKKQSVKTMLILTHSNNESQPKRSTFRTIHVTLGSWVAVVLLFFCISGMAWAGIWGEKMVQAWNQFPAGKWSVEPTPVSSLPNSQAISATIPITMPQPAQPHVHGVDGEHVLHTHGNMLNDGKTKEVPWILEFTPMPRSGTQLGTDGLPTGTPITLDSVDSYAKSLGFSGRYQINLPQDDKDVWTISQDSMSYDMTSPVADQTVHIDRYTGKVLADNRYEDYNAFGKFMATGLALHMGTMGLWSIIANVLFCLAVIAISISGMLMWWQRRPDSAKDLQPPASGKKLPIPWQFAILLLVVACIFPTAIMAIVVVALLDYLVLSLFPNVKNWLT